MMRNLTHNIIFIFCLFHYLFFTIAEGTATGIGQGKYEAFETLKAEYPAGFTFMKDGRLIYLERFKGDVVLYDEGNSSKKTIYTVPNIVQGGEDGLLGVAVHPDYPTKPYLYIYCTRRESGKNLNQILRIDIDTQSLNGTGYTKIFESNRVAGKYHDGGRILFRQSDKKLYVVVGDAHVSANAQNLNTDTGKILRMNDDGTAPSDNPFPDKLVFAYGIRNSFGFNFDPVKDMLWESENGPSCNDEVNLITKGSNYGWGPKEKCPNTNQDGAARKKPKYVWKKNLPSVVGVAFFNSTTKPLLVGAYNFGKIFEFTLNTARNGIKRVITGYTHPSSKGTVISLEMHPITTDVYFSTTNGIYRLAKRE